MGFDAGRLRRGELIAAGGGIVLLVALFLLPWFEFGGAPGRLAANSRASASLDGWRSLTDIRWILLIAIVVSLALVLFTATRRSPAIPVTLSMLTCMLGGLSSLLVIYRLIDHPGAASGAAPTVARPGIYLGLIAAVAIAYGGYLSMRAESSPFGDPASVETVRTAWTGAGSMARTGAGSASRAEADSAPRTESSSAGRTGRDV